ncbi:hypothetical protein HKX42_00185 [Salinisphaera sp. USBA-960]|nr:hypothetical protein [Salifodinibacter halophilus]NNC25309.1 hypothetical protein [Salifodinibacter halophilus]
MILLIGSIIILTACATTTRPAKPTKPTLDATTHDGMVCFSQQDATQLGVYIQQLERVIKAR